MSIRRVAYFILVVTIIMASPSSATSKNKMKVTVVGGTHGNEYTGVWCIKSLDRQLAAAAAAASSSSSSSLLSSSSIVQKCPNLKISTLLGNPIAHLQNKRFVDQDLNRQFSYKALARTTKEESSSSSSCCLESNRAKEINQLLGPKKFEKYDDDNNDQDDTTNGPNTDCIIDLHTTTTNMGTTLIVGEGDPLMAQAAAYIIHKCSSSDGDERTTTSDNNNNNNINNKVCVLMHTHKDQRSRPHLSSIAPHALSIEVGPVPQGILRHDVVEKTQRALDAALEFLQRHQTDPKALQEELTAAFPGGGVPCYRSAPAKRSGEMSSKIPWPCDGENENFPSWMVHKSVQDRDFREIRTGDPLFVDLDGNIINYDGSHGSPVLLMFVNEGGYYYSSSGTGISVARRERYSLETGKLIV